MAERSLNDLADSGVSEPGKRPARSLLNSIPGSVTQRRHTYAPRRYRLRCDQHQVQ